MPYRQPRQCFNRFNRLGPVKRKRSRNLFVEAMALGRPVVSAIKGCSGLGVVLGEHLLNADDPADFADYVIRLLRDAELCEELARAARKLVEERYSFTCIEHLLREVLEAPEGGAVGR